MKIEYQSLEKKLKISFKNKKLLVRALTHKSFDKENNNEKIEFLGDRVLGLVIANKLLEIYPNEKEGILDKKFANLVNKKTCLQIANKLDLHKYILTFKDNGKGIPHALIPRITERFYRVPDNKLENIEGTGLGLAIVKHIALAHDAKLNISSRIGVGTKIEILFEKKLSSTRLDL